MIDMGWAIAIPLVLFDVVFIGGMLISYWRHPPYEKRHR